MEAVRCDNGRPFFMERLWNGGFPAAGLWSNGLWGGLWGGGFPAAGLWDRRFFTAVMNLSCGCFVYIRKIF